MSSIIKLKIAYFCNLCYLVFEMSIPIFLVMKQIIIYVKDFKRVIQ